ncbi:MAG TPA: rod-binding protein [Candidatus Polarisedimenticolia bacterium]|nr:rod-binding protein [Candidatus Polarisedimenticolia bacterium]
MSPLPGVGPAPARPAGDPRAAEREKLRAAAEAFESLFVRQMLKTMREAQLEDGFFGGGSEASSYEAMFEEHMSEALSVRSPFGIGRMLEQGLAPARTPEGQVSTPRTDEINKGRGGAAVERHPVSAPGSRRP